MKRLAITSFTSALVLLTLTVAVTLAQKETAGKSDEGVCDANCYLGCYAGDLNLSDAQKTQMQERIARHREATAGLREQLRTLCEQGGSNPDGAAINEAAVGAAAQSRANLRAELEVAHARLMSELNSLLTPEQQARRVEQQRLRQERRRAGRSQRGKLF